MNGAVDSPLAANARKTPGSGWKQLSILLPTLFCGCAAMQTEGHNALAALQLQEQPTSSRKYDFARDTFAFANELTWDYSFDAEGRWTGHARVPKAEYSLHCFVLARSAEQFFKFARFDPQRQQADPQTYRRLIHRIVTMSPRKRLPEAEKVVVPGYADLREFSAARASLLKQECGSAFQSYFQRGNWRMIFPFSRHEQEKMSGQLLKALRNEAVAVAHVVQFPSLSINHALLLFDGKPGDDRIEFSAYDPNCPERPLALSFDRQTRTFSLPLTHYYPGGVVDVYQVYHRWNY